MTNGKLRIILSGDTGTGKSYLANMYRGAHFQSIPSSDVEELYTTTVTNANKQYELEIVDTVDNEMYSDSKRRVMFQECDCVIFTYSIDDIQSFNNLISRYSKLPIMLQDHIKWTIVDDHIRKFPPIILVGTKSDNQIYRQVSAENAHKLSSELALNGAMECSSIMGLGVDEVFQKAVELGLQHQKCGKKYEYTEENEVVAVEKSSPLTKTTSTKEVTKQKKRGSSPNGALREHNQCCILM